MTFFRFENGTATKLTDEQGREALKAGEKNVKDVLRWDGTEPSVEDALAALDEER